MLQFMLLHCDIGPPNDYVNKVQQVQFSSIVCAPNKVVVYCPAGQFMSSHEDTAPPGD